ncbi:MAG: pilus assembly protein TadG-related protein [Acidobacteriota bacterium]|nr:pilus assembly protein TadG-related protein [Blastocatellia bacterium]MDW8239458.1 pilus assembly protein TadG-related protein [Acidobacteriota bacterium]
MKSAQPTRRQRGTMLALIAAGAIAIMGSAALAVDIGYFFTVRNQMQNAIDAAALAAAQGLINDPGNYTESGMAKRWAIETAAKNMAAGQPVILSPSDITFPTPNTAKIRYEKTVDTFLGRAIGINEVDLKVAAKAVPSTGVSGAVAGSGVRPWAILDQFGHGALCVPVNDCESPKPHGEFKNYPHTWNGVTVQSDHYKSPYDPEFDRWDLSAESDCGQVTGLLNPRDVTGQRVTLKSFKSCNGSNPWLTPGNFGPIALGSTGASTYQTNIVQGYRGLVRIGDILPTETGDMVGPTQKGVRDLVAQDPNAYMTRNAAGRWVVLSPLRPGIVNESPRIVPIPLYGVYHTPGNGRTTFKVVSIASFFVEGSNGKEVWGRFVQIRAKNADHHATPSIGGVSTTSGSGRMVNTTLLVETP